MCVICTLEQDRGDYITSDILEQMWDTNSDGGGVSWIEDGEIHLYKSMLKDEFVPKALGLIKKHSSKSPILLHCRIGTHGLVNLDNCHPFPVNKNVVMAHNGVLTGYTSNKASELSDTRSFINTALRPLPNNFVRNRGILQLIESSIGGGNKLAFLTDREEIIHVNKEAGKEEEEGVWFSNNLWKVGSARYQNGYWAADGYGDFDFNPVTRSRSLSSKRQVHRTLEDGQVVYYWQNKCKSCLSYIDETLFWDKIRMCFECSDMWEKELEGSNFDYKSFCEPPSDELKDKEYYYLMFLDGVVDMQISELEPEVDIEVIEPDEPTEEAIKSLQEELDRELYLSHPGVSIQS